MVSLSLLVASCWCAASVRGWTTGTSMMTRRAWAHSSNEKAFRMQSADGVFQVNNTSSGSSNDDEVEKLREAFDDFLATRRESDEVDTRQQQRKQVFENAIELPQPPSEPVKLSPPVILLNVNARKVTPELVAVAEDIFGSEFVYATRTADDARRAIAAIRNPSLIVPVGGDGTLASILDLLANNETNTSNHVAYVPMGTGNGAGSVVGCKSKSEKRRWRIQKRNQENFRTIIQKIHDIGSAFQNGVQAPQHEIVEIPMMELTTKTQSNENEVNTTARCFFAGVGFDSLMLQDFQVVKAWSNKHGVMPGVLGSVAGYVVALFARTLPKCVLHNKHQIRVKVSTNSPEDTTWIDHRRGDVSRRVNASESLLFRGTAGIVAAGTMPYYGGGLRLFPFSRSTSTDKFHLRIARTHPMTGMRNLYGIFRGTYRDKRNFGVLDFVGSDFTIELQDTIPVQHSGEAIGSHHRTIRLKACPEPTRFVTLTEPRLIETE